MSFLFTQKKKEKPARVSRYRAGYIPSHAKEIIDEKEAALENKKALSIGALPKHREREHVKKHAEEIKVEESKEEREEDQEEEVHIRTRSVVAPQVLDIDDDEEDKIVGLSDDSEDEDETDLRRQRLRAKMLENEPEPIEQVHKEPISIKEEEDESSEWETDSDADEEEFNAYRASLQLQAPTFVSKTKRVTLKEEEEEEESNEEAAKNKRAEETKSFLKEAIKTVEMEEERAKDESDEEGDPEEEMKKWRERELSRLVREYKLRNPDVIVEDDDGGKKRKKEKERTQMRFMQKYYHKGAFYQDEEVLQERDFTAPTLEDKMDISILPKVMQVKNFGKSGRTKYTHLADVDTTDKSAGWASSTGKRGRDRRDDREYSPDYKRRY